MALPDTAITAIETIRLGFVATVTADGAPAVSPKGTFVVIDPQTIGFAEIRSPGTIRNVRHQPLVDVSFVDPFTRKGVRINGRAEVISQGAEFDTLIPFWDDLWPDLRPRINMIVKIHVAGVKPLSTPPYDDGVSEAEMIALYKDKYAGMYP